MEYENAKNLIIKNIKQIDTEIVDLKNAFGRVLAEDLISKIDIPNFRRSALDGYCFIAEDTKNVNKDNPVELNVIEEVPAGSVATKQLKNGMAIKVLTGAKIPDNATAVTPYEIVETSKDTIKLFKSYNEGDNIVKIGEDIKNGFKFANAGEVVDIGIIGTMSSLNITKVKVYKKLKIGILSTGSELIENGKECIDGKIYNSNRYIIESSLKKLNADIQFITIVKDDLKEIEKVFLEAEKNFDIIISTGGVSVGDYDLVKNAHKNIGVNILVDKLNIKPGMACCIGVKHDKLFLGLSGNPMSAVTALFVVCMPAIKKMSGLTNYDNKFFKVKLLNSFEKITKNDRFLRSKIDIIDGELVASLNIGQGNVVIKSMINCNSFIKLKAGELALAGSKVNAFLI